MKREVMESAGLHHFAELGLILFILAFVFVIARVIFFRKEEVEHLERLPLDEDAETSA